MERESAMSDAVSNAIAAPVLVVIAGRECKLSYSMHAVLVYRAETARIERSRPQLEEPDPKCICGGRRSEHVGPNLIRLSDSTTAPEILCLRFRKEDRTSGDSLYDWRAWLASYFRTTGNRRAGAASIAARETAMGTAPLARPATASMGAPAASTMNTARV